MPFERRTGGGSKKPRMTGSRRECRCMKISCRSFGESSGGDRIGADGVLVTPETIVIRRIPSLVRSLLPPPLRLDRAGRGKGSAGGEQRGPLLAERGGHAGRDFGKAGGGIGRLDRIGSEVVEGGLAAG